MVAPVSATETGMRLNKLRYYAKPGDIIMSGGSSGFLSKLIKNAQRIQTPDGSPSRWSHVMIYVSEDCVAESTMDFKPYGGTKKRLDNGPQYNYLHDFKDTKEGMLMHFDLSDQQRFAILTKAQAMIECGFRYPILGLLGSYLSYWIFRWFRSNPLNGKYSLYCSAFVQEAYRIIGIDFDKERTARNTSPEKISQFTMPGLVKIDVSEGGGEEFESVSFNDVDEQWAANY